MKRILIVEDEQDIQELLEAYLGDAGYETATAGDGIEAVSLFQQEAFDLVLLDVMLPKLDGFGVCELIRRQSRVPIVLLTALDGEAEQLRGFDLEIDDYITKPFSMRELLARVKANIRRTEILLSAPPPTAAKRENQIVQGRIRIDTEEMVAYKDNLPLDLTQREYELIKFLAAQPGKVFSREGLMEHVWNYEGYVGDVRAVDVAVRRLREKVEDDPASPQFILTRRGLGYLFHGEE